MVRKRVVIATGVVLAVLAIAGLTVLALTVSVRAALWGMVGFFSLLLVIRLLSRDDAWLTARSKLFDSLFLTAIILALVLTISAVSTPSPV